MVHIGIGLGCDWPVARLAIDEGNEFIIQRLERYA